MYIKHKFINVVILCCTELGEENMNFFDEQILESEFNRLFIQLLCFIACISNFIFLTCNCFIFNS